MLVPHDRDLLRLVPAVAFWRKVSLSLNQKSLIGERPGVVASEVDDENKEGQDQDVQGDTRASKNLVLLFIISGILILLVYAFGEASPTVPLRSFARLFAGLMLVSAAGFAPGGLTGFLFGIPRSLQARGSQGRIGTEDVVVDSSKTAPGQPRAEPTYASNTNLEEISDWLTKIIVGLGLVNLKNIHGYLKAAAAYFVSLSMCPQGCVPIPESAVLSILIYFSICGFFFAYLLTRLALPAAFSRADRSVLAQVKKENKKIDRRVSSLKATEFAIQAREYINDADKPVYHGKPASVALLYRALDTAKKALENDPNSALAYVQMGRALKRLSLLTSESRLLSEAVDAVEKAKTLDDKSDAAFYNAACYKSLLKQHVEGILQDLKTAISINPALKELALIDPDLDWVRTHNNDKFMEALNG